MTDEMFGAGGAGAQGGVGVSGGGGSPAAVVVAAGFPGVRAGLAGRSAGRRGGGGFGGSELDAEFDAPACGRCGAAMTRRGTRATAPLSLLGRLSLRRDYGTCRCSKGGLHVLDRALGIAGRRGAKQVGREIAAWDEAAAALGEAPAETMYCSPDGTGVPVVRRDAGTGEDGKPSKTREAKVAVFHTAERKDPKTGLAERDAGSARHTAAIDSAASKDVDAEPSAFARRLRLAAERLGFAAAKRQVVVADGAKWIWNAVAELFPNAICIVDVWHAQAGAALSCRGRRHGSPAPSAGCRSRRRTVLGDGHPVQPPSRRREGRHG